MGDSVARTPFPRNGKKEPQRSQLEEQARKPPFAQKQRSTQEKELQDCRSTLRSMPSTGRPNPDFSLLPHCALLGTEIGFYAETRHFVPLLVVWGTVAHLSLKRRWCSQVKKLLTSATPDLQRPIFRKYIDLFIAHNRTLTLN